MAASFSVMTQCSRSFSSAPPAPPPIDALLDVLLPIPILTVGTERGRMRRGVRERGGGGRGGGQTDGRRGLVYEARDGTRRAEGRACTGVPPRVRVRARVRCGRNPWHSTAVHPPGSCGRKTLRLVVYSTQVRQQEARMERARRRLTLARSASLTTNFLELRYFTTVLQEVKQRTTLGWTEYLDTSSRGHHTLVLRCRQ